MRYFHLLILLPFLFTFESCHRTKEIEVKKEKVGDVDLAYYTRGSGDPLVMIMGFRGTMAIWDPALLNALEKNFKLILFDSRGVGLSSDTQEDHTTIDQMAADTANLIKALGYKKAHVLGWSMGSRIAIEMALKHPDVVGNLILCSPNPGGTFQAERKTDAYNKLTNVDLSPEEGLSLIFPDTSEGYQASADFFARLTEGITLGTIPNDLVISNQTIERQVHALSLWDKESSPYEQLDTIKIPTLVTGGLSDVLDSPENVRLVASRIPFAWTAYFPGAGHYFLSQNHQHFADLVTLFIESTRNTHVK